VLVHSGLIAECCRCTATCVEWFGRVCVALGADPPTAFRAWVSSLGASAQLPKGRALPRPPPPPPPLLLLQVLSGLGACVWPWELTHLLHSGRGCLAWVLSC
jgi:hypothetical protein